MSKNLMTINLKVWRQKNAAEAGRRALLASRTNVIFSVPMVMFMTGTQHFFALPHFTYDSFPALFFILVVVVAGGPVEVVAHDPAWADRFAAEASALSLFGSARLLELRFSGKPGKEIGERGQAMGVREIDPAHARAIVAAARRRNDAAGKLAPEGTDAWRAAYRLEEMARGNTERIRATLQDDLGHTTRADYLTEMS